MVTNGTRRYLVNLPPDYNKICEIGRLISDTIGINRVAQPDHIAQVLGQDAVLPYYFMNALAHSIENEGLFPIYGRRNDTALMEHSFSAAFSSYFRYLDQVIASHFFPTPREIRGGLVHDGPEDFGQSLLGALVVINCIEHVLGKELGKETAYDADAETNKNALLLGPLESRLKNMRVPIIDHDGVYKAFTTLRDDVKVRLENLQEQYGRVLGAFTSFRTYIEQKVDYMPPSQKQYLLQKMNTLINRTQRLVSGRQTLKTGETKKLLRSQYGHVMGVIDDGKFYPQIDRRFLLLGDPKDKMTDEMKSEEYFLSMKMLLYRDHIRQIANRVLAEARKYAIKQIDGDGYLATAMISLSEFAHNARTMDTTPTHARSMFLKGGIKIEVFGSLAEELRTLGHNPQRLESNIDWAYRSMNLGLRNGYSHHERSADTDTAAKKALNLFQAMRESMGDLEQRVASILTTKRKNQSTHDLSGNGEPSEIAQA